ncbi:MAG: peptidase [Flavobacterium sp. MedPE-SWcel]|uniref:M90 family metallopeptidase n=1 Tax=uncultured Flavobacterium sp. TaxID=165435 RepID=UPI00091E5C3C|nr:M90 family metallopeptidase [uncultured Flavobacterium sp.]OIQ21166.1 MAG: peptidase [Flavobacterium sp. MedPE-SWcel]
MAYLIPLGLLLFLAIHFYNKNKKRAIKSFPKEWHNVLIDNVRFYKNLTAEDQVIFQKRIMIFLSEVYIDSVAFELDDVDRILIASSAVIPVFGFKEWSYSNLSGVTVYPDYFNINLEFHNKAESRNIGGMVGTGQFENQMILSRKALHHGFANKTDKNNTGIHEFVHLIDKMDGNVDGIPQQLLNHEYSIPWLDLIHKKIEAINDDKSDIRNYGGTNQAEFFAVASEYFFERPDLLRIKHPKLYKMLEQCFNPNSKLK